MKRDLETVSVIERCCNDEAAQRMVGRSGMVMPEVECRVSESSAEELMLRTGPSMPLKVVVAASNPREKSLDGWDTYIISNCSINNHHQLRLMSRHDL